ncbi:MAG: AAA family ATPase [Gammaproteobacteria bacterium]|nr:MAG: AAA family ATPase [Gammaproteobacteria bacterium]
MYESFFGLKELPFSIAPDPRYLYMSERHREALAHLLYGTGRDGGFVLLTGEVGTGKTTVCRRFLQKLPENTDVAFIVHPRLTARELLATICDELAIKVRPHASVKALIDAINAHLLEANARGRHVVLIIDEAQNLSTDVLEQLRLLTNLETDRRKLLQIILLGQPELQDMLARPELRQLAQRITARYHLDALSLAEVDAYITYRLGVAGCRRPVFSRGAVRRVYRHTRGIPRLINLLCDRALLGAYGEESPEVTPAIVNKAARELGLADMAIRLDSWKKNWFVRGVAGGLLAGLLMWLLVFGWVEREPAIEQITDAGPVPQSGVSDTGMVLTKAPDALQSAVSAGGAVPEHPYQHADGHSLDAVQWQNQLIRARGDARQAYIDVLRLWGLSAPPENEAYLCRWLQTQGMECLHHRGNWRVLLRLDRPAILPLLAPSGEERHVALLAVKGDQATISLDGKQLTLPASLLEEHWDGRFTVVWRVPPFRSAVIRPGEIRDEQAWLSDRLQKAGYALQGQSMQRVIRQFQADSGLKADGIAGAQTLIRLNTLTDPAVPTLVN